MPSFFLGSLRRMLGAVALWSLLTAAVQADSSGVSVSTVEYRPGVRADIYLPSGTTPWGNAKPVILIIHGGGWTGLLEDRTSYAAWGDYFARQGFVAVSMDYRLAPSDQGAGAPWPAQIEDATLLVWLIRKHAANLGANPNRVFAIGGSAGGLLAGFLGATNRQDSDGTSSQVQGVITLWAPWNLAASTEGLDSSAANIVANLLDRNPDGSLHAPYPNSREAASPINYLSATSSPALLLHGTEDHLVAPTQSSEACRAMAAVGVACQLVLLDGEGHHLPQRESNMNLLIEAIRAKLTDWLK